MCSVSGTGPVTLAQQDERHVRQVQVSQFPGEQVLTALGGAAATVRCNYNAVLLACYARSRIQTRQHLSEARRLSFVG